MIFSWGLHYYIISQLLALLSTGGQTVIFVFIARYFSSFALGIQENDLTMKVGFNINVYLFAFRYLYMCVKANKENFLNIIP